MLCKVIATPCARGGAWNGWNFAPDTGRSLMPGEIRFTYNPVLRDHFKKILVRAKREYSESIDEHYKTYKASKQALEYTMAMRAWKKEKEKFSRDARVLKHESL